MKKGDILQCKIEKTEFPNKGIFHIDDRRGSIKGVIPGQTVRFRAKKVRKDRLEGTLMEIVEKSPLEDRIPACPHFGVCGGCAYQTLSYENQKKVKEGQVRFLLENVVEDLPWEGIKESPVDFGYRNKMEFSFGDERKDGPLALGLHKKNSFYDIVQIIDCKIVREAYNQIVNSVVTFFSERKIPYYKKRSHEGYLRHLVVRSSIKTGNILINLVTSSQMEVDLQPLVQQLIKLPINGKIVGILHTINDSMADVVKKDDMHLLYGQDYFYEYLLDLKFKISPFSFFQTNTLGAEVLYETARDFIGDIDDKIVFDLYSGTGTIGQMMAAVAKKVIGVEIVEEAVEAAKENATMNGIDNCEFIAGDVLKVVDTLDMKPDVIVLDPPRDGIHPKAIGKIIGFGAKEILYISCKPTSLVRDLEILLEAGYEVKRACAVDMFPQNPNVETVVLLGNQKTKPDSHIKLSVDMDEFNKVKNGEK